MPNENNSNELNEKEQAVYNKILAKVKESTSANKSDVDIETIAKQIANDLKNDKSAIDKQVEEEVNKRLDEIKKNTNPFEDLQRKENFSVNDKVKHPIGVLAIAAVKAEKNKMTLDQYLGQEIKANPTDNRLKGVAGYLAKSYHNGNNQEGLANLKSLGIDSITNGAGFSDPSADGEFIEKLNALSIVRSAQPSTRRLVNGKATANRGASNGIAYYVNSGEKIPSSQPGYDQIVMTAKKLASLIEIDNEAIKFDLWGMAAQVQSDIETTIALYEDNFFLNGSGNAGEPLGILNRAKGSNTFAMTNSPTADKAGKDLQKAYQALLNANVRMVRPVWLMHTSNKGALMAQTTSTGADKRYAKTLNDNNTIMQAPVFTSTQIPQSVIGIVDMEQVIVADAYDLEIESDESFKFANDQTVIRAIRSHDLAMKHDVAVATITGVNWYNTLS